MLMWFAYGHLTLILGERFGLSPVFVRAALVVLWLVWTILIILHWFGAIRVAG
jgi:phage shock protein PspC (stress-responsive transcriptional regulator)